MGSARRGLPRYDGVYIRGKIQGKSVFYTVDTGATSTILSKKVYDELPTNTKPELKCKGVNPFSCADGRTMKYVGKAKFEMYLGSLKLERELAVAEIEDDILLGADIIQQDVDGPADLILSENIMKLRGVPITLEQVGVSRVRRVRAADHYVIPGMSEMLVDVFVDPAHSKRDDDTFVLIEPTPNFSDTYSLVLASSLVDVENNTTVKARIMNPFTEPKSIKQDAVIGNAECVDFSVTTLLNNEDKNDVGNFNAIRRINFSKPDVSDMSIIRQSFQKSESENLLVPPHLDDLFLRSCNEKSESEREAIHELLTEYQNTFSKDDYDLGLTHLTEHSIDTGIAKPLKQPPRRLPMAFAGEDKKAIEKLLKQGSVRPSTSPWASPIVLVKKKDGSIWPCIDCRRVNSVSVKDAYALSRTSDCLDVMSDSVLFST